MIKTYSLFLLSLIIFLHPMQGIASDKLQPLPEVQSLDINTFVAQAQMVEKDYTEDLGLSFKMQIPSNFTIRENNLLKNSLVNERLYGEVFNAYGPALGDVRPYVSVQSIKPDRLISAKNWFLANILKHGYTLRGIESDEKGNKYDAFYVRFDTIGNTEIIRELGYLHQNRIVTAAYVLPIALWESDRDKQIFSIKSFEFRNETEIKPSENLLDYSYLESFSIQYPKSWLLKDFESDAVNALSMNLLTVDINGFLIASIDLSLVSSRSLRDRIDQSIYETNLPSLIRQRQKKIDDEGFAAGDVMERHNYDLNVPAAMQITEVYPLRKQEQEVFVNEEQNPVTKEFWLTVIQTPKDNGKNYVLSMIAPSRTLNLYEWAISVKAYETIIESIR